MARRCCGEVRWPGPTGLRVLHSTPLFCSYHQRKVWCCEGISRARSESSEGVRTVVIRWVWWKPLTKSSSEYWFTGQYAVIPSCSRKPRRHYPSHSRWPFSRSGPNSSAKRCWLVEWYLSIDVDATGQLKDFEDDEDGDTTDESIIFTPLSLALLFGKLAATKALLKHISKFDKVGNTGVYSRQCILDGLMMCTTTAKFISVLGFRESIGAWWNSWRWKQFQINEKVRKYRWNSWKWGWKLNWNKVRMMMMMVMMMMMMMPLTVIAWTKQLSHSMIRLWRKMRRPARIHVVSDGLKYASAIVSLQLAVHPKLFLSRNAQHITDEMAHTALKDLLQRFKTKNLIFSPENVIACITAY